MSEHIFSLIKFNPYNCCNPKYFFFLAILFSLLYLTCILCASSNAHREKPDNVAEQDVVKLFSQKCLSYGYFWVSWSIILLSPFNISIDLFIVLAFLGGNCIAGALLFPDSGAIAYGVDWKNNPDSPFSPALHHPKAGKSARKNISKVASKFYRILPFVTVLILLFGLRSTPPLNIMLYYGIAVSIILAIFLTSREMRTS